MTYPELLSSLYEAYDTLHPLWSERMARAGSLGAIVFLPGDYVEAGALAEATCSYWSVTSIKEYITGEREPDPGLMDLLDYVDPEEMFLAMIVEPPSAGKRSAVHVHKITRLGAN
jgi:hypothetical protein